MSSLYSPLSWLWDFGVYNMTLLPPIEAIKCLYTRDSWEKKMNNTTVS